MSISHYAIDISHYAKDISHHAIDISRYAIDISHHAIDISRYAKDISHHAIDISHYAKGISRYAIDISHCAKSISHHAKDISHYAKPISHWEKRKNRGEKHIYTQVFFTWRIPILYVISYLDKKRRLYHWYSFGATVCGGQTSQRRVKRTLSNYDPVSSTG
jgi:hypothetical protein